ncbi:23S rRNA (adenine-N6)-dimethyltransferase [Halopolyspora algeriensis]|uniref:23S rRNA (Adenine-N6)-dimethyltransferase n=1 Tax=Halopolyspora algeriensis TaxID=1500506 RepID=A0A368VHW2_9ACTN|nr:23S ribosomal RNA methyltransferase Erm [Halopolyspora algeriensis]RCW39785.1 23S rRNA (adenine-N6)-dimethyltransferase [Halopolyspora algeriensis]TQM56440.1 23S rRNA (adenine-N6)-dimethyltransferase [Halopolyspora algeriensis]
MSSPYQGGRHELGQNFLTDTSVINTIEKLVAHTTGPIVEIGAGDGAVTMPLSRSGRPITAVEIDPKRARRLRRRAPEHVTVVNDDMLRFRFPHHPHVLVGNLPFHLTTALQKRLLAAEHWHTAILLVQWEVARRRAGVGGASMLTASWWPWYEFAVHARVPARSFRPVPSVDGGLLVMSRRSNPLVRDRVRYQRFVQQVFTGRGRGLSEILVRTGRIGRTVLHGWSETHRVSPRALPKDLTAEQWADLWNLVCADRRTAGR